MGETPIPLDLADYEIIRPLGEGPIGSVFEARRISDGRLVAIKVLSGWPGLTTRALKRIRLHVKTTGRLSHPGLVRFESYAESGLTPYLVMERIKGPSFDQIIREMKVERANREQAQPAKPKNEQPKNEQAKNEQAKNDRNGEPNSPVDFKKFASALATAAEALDHAHRTGLFHHDIKPSNLILGEENEVFVTDFGLANLLQQAGMMIGDQFRMQPQYSSPEQESSRGRAADHRSDIYSLGSVLYELLTLRRPIEFEEAKNGSRLSTENKIPVRPRKIDSRIPRDLQTICLKALEQSPEERYQSAGHMAKDLRAFADERRISARPKGIIRRTSDWGHRNRIRVATALVCVGLLGAGSFLAYRGVVEYRHAQVVKFEKQFNSAILATLSGDPEFAEPKIDDVKSSWKKQGWEPLMLTGQLELFSGRPQEAIEDLEKALNQKEDSVAIKTLLGLAYRNAGRLDDFAKIEKDLLEAKPSTVREKIFLGNWVAQFDPQSGQRMLQAALEESDAATAAATLARMFLAKASLRVAHDTLDASLHDELGGEARSVRLYCYENGYARLFFVQTAMVVESAAREGGPAFEAILPKPLEKNQRSTDDADTPRLSWTERVEEAMNDLHDRFPKSYAVALALNWEAHRQEDPVLRLETFRQSIELLSQWEVEAPVSLRRTYTLELLQQGHVDEAQTELAKMLDQGVSVEFLVAAIRTQTEGDTEATAQELLSWSPPFSDSAWYRPVGLLVLGKKDEAVQQFSELKQTTEFAYNQEWNQQLLAFGAGELDGAELLESAQEPTASRYKASQAHFLIAMTHLAEGNRSEAKAHFEECLQAHIFMSREYQTARTILQMWKQDPSWPNWIKAPEASQ